MITIKIKTKQMEFEFSDETIVIDTYIRHNVITSENQLEFIKALITKVGEESKGLMTENKKTIS